MATPKFDLVSKTTIIKGEKPSKGVEAIEASNPHQMNRVLGYLDGTKVSVAQRAGKGGIAFNKLVGGKVFAVAADSFAPVYEKAKEGEKAKTNVQKVEDGLPLYSSSGFYTLSSKEYPAQDIFEAFTKLNAKGTKALLITEKAISEALQSDLESELDLEMLEEQLAHMLDASNNLVAKFDEGANKKRNRVIETAKMEAEDAGDTFSGVEFKELHVSPADGNPFLYVVANLGGTVKEGYILLEEETTVDEKTSVKILTVDDALLAFKSTNLYKNTKKLLEAGTPVSISVVQGNLMRTSVSFRNRVDLLLKEQEWPKYGDAVYIGGALKGWTKGIATVMFSLHPGFPSADYSAHHYVVALRQAEVGMNKVGDSWGSPLPIVYDMPNKVLGN